MTLKLGIDTDGKIARLTSELATSRTETAMAFEVAGDLVLDAQGRAMMGSGQANAAHDAALSVLAGRVRALTPAHAKAALAACDKAKDDRIAELEAKLDALDRQADALLAMDASGNMVPHGIGGLAREIITKQRTAINALRARIATKQSEVSHDRT